MPHLRLAIEPIPASSRLASLAKMLAPEQWDFLRRAVYRQAGYRCQICGAESRLHCHEVWRYAYQAGRQWLAGFLALCPDCHEVKHITTVHDAILRAKLVRHFLAVNQLSPSEGEPFLRAALDRQRRLDRRRWIVDYGAYNTSVPCLADTQRRCAYLRSSGRYPPARRAVKSLLASESGQSWETDGDF